MKTAFPGMSSNRGKHQPVFDDKTGRFCVKIDRRIVECDLPVFVNPDETEVNEMPPDDFP